MTDQIYYFLANNYLWLEAFHIVAVISWLAGLLYLPRLFVYHTQVGVGSDQDQLFQTMEYKLIKIIMNPAMIVSWIFGLLLIYATDVFSSGDLWIYAKLSFVSLLTFFHIKLGIWRKAFVAGTNQKTEGFFRKVNEVPTVLMIAVVFVVVLKPF